MLPPASAAKRRARVRTQRTELRVRYGRPSVILGGLMEGARLGAVNTGRILTPWHRAGAPVDKGSVFTRWRQEHRVRLSRPQSLGGSMRRWGRDGFMSEDFAAFKAAALWVSMHKVDDYPPPWWPNVEWPQQCTSTRRRWTAYRPIRGIRFRRTRCSSWFDWSARGSRRATDECTEARLFGPPEARAAPGSVQRNCAAPRERS